MERSPEIFRHFGFYRFFCGNCYENNHCGTGKSFHRGWCVIPERSWLGDEASFDWARVININMELDHLEQILKLHLGKASA